MYKHLILSREMRVFTQEVLNVSYSVLSAIGARLGACRGLRIKSGHLGKLGILLSPEGRTCSENEQYLAHFCITRGRT